MYCRPSALALLLLYETGPTEKYDKAMAALIAAEAQWTYAAAAMVPLPSASSTCTPSMIHKQQIMTARGSKTLGKNLRSNPFIYKAVGENAGPNAIIYDNDGEVGAYNRTNRSLHHMVENMASVLFGRHAIDDCVQGMPFLMEGMLLTVVCARLAFDGRRWKGCCQTRHAGRPNPKLIRMVQPMVDHFPNDTLLPGLHAVRAPHSPCTF